MSIDSYSVIIPAYNRANTIREAIQSVIWQTFQPTEIIVVDDGSTDQTVEVAKACVGVKVVKTNGRTGACAARNLGVSHATTSWIAFQDSDDIWFPSKMENLTRAIEESKVSVAFSAFVRITNTSAMVVPTKLPLSKVGWHVLSTNEITSALRTNCLSTQTLVCSREAFDSVDGFDVRLPRFQDWELAIRLFQKWPTVFVEQPQIAAIEQGDSISRNRVAGNKARRLIHQKHRDLYARYPGVNRGYLWDLMVREAASGDWSNVKSTLLQLLGVGKIRGEF